MNHPDDGARGPVQEYNSASITLTKSILRDIWDRDGRVGLVPMLYGPGGIGKTSLVGQVGQELGHERLIKLIASKMRPEDFSGIPFPYKAGYSRFHPPLNLFRLTKEYDELAHRRHRKRQELGKERGEYRGIGKTILFLDELPNAHPDVQAPLHSLVEERTVGLQEFELHDHVRLIAAGNRPEDGAYVHPLSIPMATRLSPHIKVKPTFEEWEGWARGSGVHPTVIAFLRNHPSLLDPSPARGSREVAYATPRTWAKAGELLAAIRNPDALAVALEGTVGRGPASELLTFVHTVRGVPSVDELARDPVGAPTFAEDPDIAHVVVENIIAAIRQNPRKYANPLTTYGLRLHAGYQALLFPAIMGIDTRMPEDVLTEIVQGESAQAVMTAFAEVNRIEDLGDQAMRAPTLRARAR